MSGPLFLTPCFTPDAGNLVFADATLFFCAVSLVLSADVFFSRLRLRFARDSVAGARTLRLGGRFTLLDGQLCGRHERAMAYLLTHVNEGYNRVSRSRGLRLNSVLLSQRQYE